MIGDALSELVPGVPVTDEHEAVYDVIGLPFSAGATNDTRMRWLPRATVGCAGALGAAAGTKGAEGAEVAPVPMMLVAATVHVYVLPLVRPLTVIGDAVSVLLDAVPPLLDAHAAV